MAQTYIIRDLDPATWRRFKSRAARQGVPARTVLVNFIEAYASERYHVRALAGKTPHYLTSRPGVLTPDPALAEVFPTMQAAQAAIIDTQTVLGRPEPMIVQEAV